jgi:hypothetical protein
MTNPKVHRKKNTQRKMLQRVQERNVLHRGWIG